MKLFIAMVLFATSIFLTLRAIQKPKSLKDFKKRILLERGKAHKEDKFIYLDTENTVEGLGACTNVVINLYRKTYRIEAYEYHKSQKEGQEPQKVTIFKEEDILTSEDYTYFENLLAIDDDSKLFQKLIKFIAN